MMLKFKIRHVWHKTWILQKFSVCARTLKKMASINKILRIICKGERYVCVPFCGFLRRLSAAKSKWRFLDSFSACAFSPSCQPNRLLSRLFIYHIKTPWLRNDAFNVAVRHFGHRTEACRIIRTLAAVYSMCCMKGTGEETLLILWLCSMFRHDSSKLSEPFYRPH